MQPAKEGKGTLVALCALAASTLIVEITLTKFLSFKLWHHYTFAVLSMVILMFGASGIFCFAAPKWLGIKEDRPWDAVAAYATWYSITLCIAVIVFCVCPSSSGAIMGIPQMTNWALPLFFTILSIPFFLAGVCISQTFIASKHKVTVIYFFDLLAAAIGVSLCPVLLPNIGGYGTIAFSAGLGLLAAVAYWQNSRPAALSGWLNRLAMIGTGALAIVALLSYPGVARKYCNADMLFPRDPALYCVLRDFSGIESTHWNAIARVDVSKTGTSNDMWVYKFGLAPEWEKEPIPGRMLLMDGTANTRQFKKIGELFDQKYFETALWASPYVARPDCKNALIMGGGGGLDILVAKYHRVPNIDVVDMNPTICRILKGELDDPDKSYTGWLQSDANSKVTVNQDEARHFSTASKPGTYDTIQASGVDTLTAIQTGGLSLVENYLYTVDAVKDYTRMLKPDGVLSLTHWFRTGPSTSLRMFLTYFEYLDSIGVKEPWKHVVVIASFNWTDSLLKMSPFTHEELVRIRAFATKSGYTVLFDPENKTLRGDEFERSFTRLGFMSQSERKQAIDTDPNVPCPVGDDKPYFYSFGLNHPDLLINVNNSSIPLQLMITTFIFGMLLLLVPVMTKRDQLNSAMCVSVGYFATTGFSFMLYETAIIQLFSIFVGGPFYSLSVVLVAVLVGYSTGSLIASYIKCTAKTFLAFAAGLLVLFVGLYLGIPELTRQLLPLSLPARLVICGSVAFIGTVPIGIAVSSAMSVVRNTHGQAISWMWGVSSIFNALGAICFIAITMNFGIKSCLLIIAIMYCAANLMFSLSKPTRKMLESDK